MVLNPWRVNRMLEISYEGTVSFIPNYDWGVTLVNKVVNKVTKYDEKLPFLACRLGRIKNCGDPRSNYGINVKKVHDEICRLKANRYASTREPPYALFNPVCPSCKFRMVPLCLVLRSGFSSAVGEVEEYDCLGRDEIRAGLNGPLDNL